VNALNNQLTMADTDSIIRIINNAHRRKSCIIMRLDENFF